MLVEEKRLRLRRNPLLEKKKETPITEMQPVEVEQ